MVNAWHNCNLPHKMVSLSVVIGEIFPQLILVILLILSNAFFAASEYALVAVRKTRIEELVKKGDFIAHFILDALENKENLISATQLGTTIVSLVLGWLGEPLIAKIISSFFFFLPQGPDNIIVHSLSVIISLLLLTFVTITVGELIPKTVALYKAEMVAFIIIAPLLAVAKIMRPLTNLLNILDNFILTRFGFKTPKNRQLLIDSEEEVKLLLTQIQQSGVVKKNGLEMLQNVFELSERPIKQIMTPRTEIIAVNANTSLEQLLKKIGDTYSRFPVYKKTLDNIIGFIHIKDVYRLFLEGEGNRMLSETKLIRKAISVPETKKAHDVLVDMRKQRIHLAVIYDEFGIMVGIITLEDIIESLVGEIQDEFDKPIKGIKRNSDGSYLVDGNMELGAIQRKFNLPLKGQGYTTIGGLVFGILGREPRVGDEILIGHLFFEVESIIGKRIKRIILKRESQKLGNRVHR